MPQRETRETRQPAADRTVASNPQRLGRPGDPDFGLVLPMDRFADALRQADYLVLAAPLTPETRGRATATCPHSTCTCA